MEKLGHIFYVRNPINLKNKTLPTFAYKLVHASKVVSAKIIFLSFKSLKVETIKITDVLLENVFLVIF